MDALCDIGDITAAFDRSCRALAFIRNCLFAMDSDTPHLAEALEEIQSAGTDPLIGNYLNVGEFSHDDGDETRPEVVIPMLPDDLDEDDDDTALHGEFVNQFGPVDRLSAIEGW